MYEFRNGLMLLLSLIYNHVPYLWPIASVTQIVTLESASDTLERPAVMLISLYHSNESFHPTNASLCKLSE